MTARTFKTNNVPCANIPYPKETKHGVKTINMERLGEKHPCALLFLSCVVNPILILLSLGTVAFAAALLATLMTGGLL